MTSRRSFLVGLAGASFIPSWPDRREVVRPHLIFTIRCCLSASLTFRLTVSNVLALFMRLSYGRPKRSAMPNEAAVRSRADAVLAEAATAKGPIILDVEQYLVDIRSDRHSAQSPNLHLLRARTWHLPIGSKRRSKRTALNR